jgi:hypothetical protein
MSLERFLRAGRPICLGGAFDDRAHSLTEAPPSHPTRSSRVSTLGPYLRSKRRSALQRVNTLAVASSHAVRCLLEAVVPGRQKRGAPRHAVRTQAAQGRAHLDVLDT